MRALTVARLAAKAEGRDANSIDDLIAADLLPPVLLTAPMAVSWFNPSNPLLLGEGRMRVSSATHSAAIRAG